MSGRGHGRGQRGPGRGAGRGRHTPPAAQTKSTKEPIFRGHDSELPSLNFGASAKENKPIEFLQLMGEHTAISYKPSICHAFWTIPPTFGDEEEEPEMPAEIPAGNMGKAILSQYLSDQKDWKTDFKKIAEQKQAVFALVYAQLSESSRCEIQDDEEWIENYQQRDLLYLIQRIRSTHIARQTGNPGQDRERVQMLWATIRMQPYETSFAFRKRVDDHQLERTAVGLPVIPEEDLVIGILNRLDMSRYSSLVTNYLDNERRGIADLPILSSTLWKEVKEAQVVRFRGVRGSDMESIYLSRVDDIQIDGGRGRGRGRGGRGPRGGGRGRGRSSHEEKETVGKSSTTPAIKSTAPNLDHIVCWNCGIKGHRSSTCTIKKVNFSSADDELIYLAASVPDWRTPCPDNACDDDQHRESIFFSTVSGNQDTMLLLDTQASIHIFRNPAITTDIETTSTPVTIQGITGDRVRVTQEGTIHDVGIKGYYSPNMAANIISYNKLKETHNIHYDEARDIFTATSHTGPTLTFACINGHYVMDIHAIRQAYVVSLSSKSAKYSRKQLSAARDAYEFMQRMGYISYKAAAEIVQRGSMKEIGFVRSDLVNAQDIYGTPAAYQLGQGTQRSAKCQENDQIPIHQSVNQELQVDLFYFLGQAFFLSISVLLGLIMVSHLGPGSETASSSEKNNERSRSKAGEALLMHVTQYQAKGFRVLTVTSDGEGAVKSIRQEAQKLGVELNILGRGSHTPHAEAAIRHLKNKARSTLHSLPYSLPSKLAVHLIAFVVHTSNMVPKVNSPGHLPAYTAFKGRAPNYKIDAPFPFGTAGFLQRAQTVQSNSMIPRADYCVWLGTTRNLKGTHRCLNLDTLREVTGDIFRPALLTQAAITRLKELAGSVPLHPQDIGPPESPLDNPDAPYALDPHRGVDAADSDPNADMETDAPVNTIVSSGVTEEEFAEKELTDMTPELQSSDVQSLDAPNEQNKDETPIDPSATDIVPVEDSYDQIRDESNRDEISNTEVRNAINPGYNFRQSTRERHVYAALTINDATFQFGAEVTDGAVIEELKNLINKEVFEFVKASSTIKTAIPSKMILTPKKLPNGQIDRMKARLVAGGHRQDRSLYKDQDTSSPTVALSTVLMAASIAAHKAQHVMTLDHKAAYLNASMVGNSVYVRLGKDVAVLLCKLAPKYHQFIRADGTITVKLRRALYGCIESAVLWYKELSSTLLGLGFKKNPYDECSFTREIEGRIDSILVYVDDLMIFSELPQTLTSIADALRSKYTEITTRIGKEHDFLGVHWDFRVPGQVMLSMDGYIDNILEKYGVKTKAKTPATDMLFISNPLCPKLNKVKQEVFHSCVMELHYLAKRTRSEILTAVSYCATRVLCPDEDDEKKLDRILSYLFNTRGRQLTLRIGPVIEIRAYVDASFGTYQDMKSVTGVVIQIGDATVYVKSSKQKIVTKSSTEAELVGISDALTQVLWTREFLIHHGIPVGPAVMYQDNKSTICLANRGKSTSERTRHVKIRYFFISHYIEEKEIVIRYLPTGEMMADLMTKPLHGSLFEKLREMVVGKSCDPV